MSDSVKEKLLEQIDLRISSWQKNNQYEGVKSAVLYELNYIRKWVECDGKGRIGSAISGLRGGSESLFLDAGEVQDSKVKKLRYEPKPMDLSTYEKESLILKEYNKTKDQLRLVD